MIRFIFCNDPLSPRQPDELFQAEVEAVRSLGLDYSVKDFVKSQKHYWLEACYIPSAADLEQAARVVNRFLDLQGDSLNEGIVFREFVEFEPLTQHTKSQMPLSQEYRVFVLDGEPVQVAEYWEEGSYGSEKPPLAQFQDMMRQVESRFFTMDIAKRRGGDWLIVELGDGQVAGLPERLDVLDFYRGLVQRLED